MRERIGGRIGRLGRRARIGVGVALLALGAGAAPAALRAQEADGGRALLQRAAASRVQGPKGAAVVVYEVGDFECPYCGRFAVDVFPKLDSAYVKTGKVQWVFMNLPLTMHANAFPAAEAALCAGGVAGRFWAMHDRLYAGQAEWSGSAAPGKIFARYAKELGLPEAAFEECVREDRVAPIILQDALYFSGAGVSGTPSFFVNNSLAAVGVKGYDEWKQILDKALQEAAAKKKP
ncbi:MAG TPA: thioredoxin domain-containing protein [Longimicrobiales bacterium]|nr:thioredoxin domain-containing protein [Longimicrobiales bacterium]